MFIIMPPSLRKEVKQNLKTSAYSKEEVHQLYQNVCKDHAASLKGWKRALYICLGIMILFFALSISQIKTNVVILYSLLATFAFLALILLFVRFAYVDRVKRQFRNAAQQGNYSIDSF